MLTETQLQSIIEQFNEEELKSSGIFGIMHYGGGSDESFIRANSEGLQMFALQLLKAAEASKNLLSQETKNTMLFEYDENWVDDNSDVFIQYVEPIANKQTLKPRPKESSEWAGKLAGAGCVIVAIVMLVAMVTGFITLFNRL